MNVLVWIAPGTWPAVVAAARGRPEGDALTLVAAADSREAAPLGHLGGLFGRGHPDPHDRADTLSHGQAQALLDQAVAALGRECRARVVAGPTERAVVTAAADADWLILARDGDRSRLGPHSLGRHARFVLDHVPCTVQLIWPESAPSLATIPPPPPPGAPGGGPKGGPSPRR